MWVTAGQPTLYNLTVLITWCVGDAEWLTVIMANENESLLLSLEIAMDNAVYIFVIYISFHKELSVFRDPLYILCFRCTLQWVKLSRSGVIGFETAIKLDWVLTDALFEEWCLKNVDYQCQLSRPANTVAFKSWLGARSARWNPRHRVSKPVLIATSLY